MTTNWISIATRPAVVRRALKYALIVGTLLILINHGDAILRGDVSIDRLLRMGLTQGILAALLADTAPASLKGTAFGLFNLVSGLCLLLASGLAGWLWDSQGAAATFYAGAGFAAAAALLLLNIKRPAGETA